MAAEDLGMQELITQRLLGEWSLAMAFKGFEVGTQVRMSLQGREKSWKNDLPSATFSRSLRACSKWVKNEKTKGFYSILCQVCPWPRPALPGAVPPPFVPLLCPATATAPGGSSTSHRSCQALQQVLMMDGINGIISEV